MDGKQLECPICRQPLGKDAVAVGHSFRHGFFAHAHCDRCNQIVLEEKNGSWVPFKKKEDANA